MGLAPNTALAVVTAACGDDEWADVDARRRLVAVDAGETDVGETDAAETDVGETDVATGANPVGVAARVAVTARTFCGAFANVRLLVLAKLRPVTRGARAAGSRTASADDPESGVSAEATAAPTNATAPMPRATANPPTRPTNREASIPIFPLWPVSKYAAQRNVRSGLIGQERHAQARKPDCSGRVTA